MISKLAVFSSVLFGALWACRPAPEARLQQESEPEGAGVASAAIDIPPTVQKNLGLTFVDVEVRQVADTMRIPGAFELQPRARHEYRMALPGRIELLVDQYERVESGAALFRFQSPRWPELLHEIIVGEQATAVEEARIEVVLAQRAESERKLELLRGRIEMLAQADFKRADLENDAAELEASLPRLAAELQLARTRVANAKRTREHALHRAATAAGLPEGQLEREVLVEGERVPFYQTIDWIEVRAVQAGVVERLAVTDGAFVQPPDPVLSIVDPERVRFRARAPQGDLDRIMSARTTHIVPPRTPGTPIGTAVAASMSLGLEAQPADRTVTLIATPEERAPWIRPGVSAYLEVVLESTAVPALAIPRAAIVQDGLQHVFFRRDPKNPGRAIRVQADMGVSDGRWVVLHSGVQRGDQVVHDGVYELKLAQQQVGGKQQSGHVHADGSVHEDH